MGNSLRLFGSDVVGLESGMTRVIGEGNGE